MRTLKCKKVRKVFITFLLSYIVVLSIPLGISSMAYIKAESVVEAQVMASNKATLERVKQLVDSKVDEFERLAQQISLNQRVKTFMTTPNPLNASDRYNIITILADLASYKNITPFIDEFFIYFPENDVLLTSTTHYRPDIFYKTAYHFDGVSYEEWHDKMLVQHYTGKFLSSEMTSLDPKENRMITYMRSLPFSKNGYPLGNIAILIDEQKIANLLSSVKELSAGSVYILASDNSIIASTAENGASLSYDDLVGKDGLIHKTINGSAMVISYISSERTNWKYVTVIPADILLNEVNRVRSITLWVTLACLVAGMLTAYFMAYRNYNPIKKLADAIALHRGNPSPKYTNEIQFIEDSFSNMLEKNEQLNLKLNRQLPILRDKLLSSLIKDHTGDHSSIIESLREYGISFPYNRFMIALFYMDKNSSFAQSNIAQNHTVLRTIIDSTVQKISQIGGIVYETGLEDDIRALIVNLSENIDKSIILDAFIEARNIAIEHHDALLTIAVGNVHDGIESLQLSYHEAIKSLEYKTVYDDGVIAYQDQAKGEGGCTDYYYPLEVELQLINNIKTGNINDAIPLLDKIFEDNFVKRRLSLGVIRCLFFDIMSTAIKTLNEVKIDYKDVFDNDPMERLLRCRNVEELHKTIKEIYNIVCQHMDKYKKSHNKLLKERILQYITEHYADEGLSQTVIAEHMRISPSYLSYFFKEQFGENMMDYINRKRIERAKELLANSKLSIVQVAKMVGCSNDMALIRIFKKYEGITPGKYKDKMCEDIQ